MNKGQYIEKYLKDSLRNIIANSVDEEIDKKIQEFKEQLIDRRNQYISEIMRGIQIIHEQNSTDLSMNYKIIFENITRIERWKIMIKIRNSEIESILDYYELYGNVVKLYLYYDYVNNEAYLRFNDNGKALCCLNDVIGESCMTIKDRYDFSSKITDIIFENERKDKWKNG